MNVSTHTTRRLVSLTGLAAVVAALAVPTALAHPATEGGDDTSRTAVVLDLRSPDTQDVTTQALGGVDPAIATAMAARQSRAVVGDLRSPDTQDVTPQALGSVDPAIASAMAAHLRRVTLGDFRSPDTRDVNVNPTAQDSPVAAPAPSDGTNWGLIGAMLAAIGLLIAGVGALGISGHGKRHGTMKPA
jgi:hypothetical protein